jgi:thioesterase domain-containing protein/acyl carrier protein
LECLGRADDQVKIRGYRIELGEIEAVLARHPAVRQVVVMAREDAPGDKRLVAYLVAENSPPDLVDQLRVLLRAALPEYMVPSYFVDLDAFPLTPNGKIDRKALPAPNAQPTTARSRGPRTTTEECLLGIWMSLLKRDGIGIDDNFFDIGGHSLLTVALVSEVKKQMGAQLSLAQVLRSPTIAGLAESIDDILGRRPGVPSPDSDALVELKAGGPRCLFLVFEGFGEVLPYLALARCMPPGYAVYGILPHRLPRIPFAHATIPEVAKHCVAQMRRRQPHGPYTIGGLCAGGVVAFAAAEQLERNGDRVDHVIILDAVAPHTRLRPWRVAAHRWERFSTAIRQLWQPRTAQMPRVPVSAVVQKVGNLIRYEIRHLIESVSVAVRFRLLNHILAKNRVWPRWIPSLSVVHILGKAEMLYNPGRVSAPIVLVKAREGVDSDLPSARLVVDPLLGWGDLTAGPLRVIDAVGGHSSMLQEPNVALIGERLTILLDSAASGHSAPARAS